MKKECLLERLKIGDKMKRVTSEEMHTIDRLASEKYGIPSIVLMENAARGAYEHIIAHHNKENHFLVVCGSGNNGGDGFAIARMLYITGYDVAINFLGKEEKLTADAKVNYDICKKLMIPFTEELKSDVIIDCIFGTGLKREVAGKYYQVIEEINHSNSYKYAIDIASGLASDTGEVLGIAIKADKTLTFQLGKIGLYQNEGIKYSGEIEIIDIFIPKELLK